MNKAYEVKIADLKFTFHVRAALDQQYVTTLKRMIEGGQELPPIHITSSKEVEEGRHRVAAALAAGRQTIPAIIVEKLPFIEKVERAVQENFGGSLPLKMADIKHTVTILIEKGASKTKIMECLGEIFPIRVLEAIHKGCMMELINRKIIYAQALIDNEHISKDEAAKRAGISPDKLDKGKNRKKDKNKIAYFMEVVSQKHTNKNNSIGQMIRQIIRLYNEGSLSIQETETFFDHLQKSYAHSSTVCDQWMARWRERKLKIKTILKKDNNATTIPAVGIPDRRTRKP
jgi:predicted DNA-binding protein (UPF0251 family)